MGHACVLGVEALLDFVLHCYCGEGVDVLDELCHSTDELWQIKRSRCWEGAREDGAGVAGHGWLTCIVSVADIGEAGVAALSDVRGGAAAACDPAGWW